MGANQRIKINLIAAGKRFQPILNQVIEDILALKPQPRQNLGTKRGYQAPQAIGLL